MTTSTRYQQRHVDNFHRCPGAWCATMPLTGDDDHRSGWITVDVAQIAQALAFLQRRYRITSTSPSIHTGGVRIGLEVRS